MERHLYVLRHAKSSWKNPALSDYDRPLKKRGKNDAPLIGKKLNKMELKIQLIVSSPAKRTKDTISIIAKELKFIEHIRYDESIYESSVYNLLSLINSFDDDFQNILIVGHNPSLTDLVNYLSNKKIENIPTCGVVGLKYNGSWKNIRTGSSNLIFFEYPKKYY